MGITQWLDVNKNQIIVGVICAILFLLISLACKLLWNTCKKTASHYVAKELDNIVHEVQYAENKWNILITYCAMQVLQCIGSLLIGLPCYWALVFIIVLLLQGLAQYIIVYLLVIWLLLLSLFYTASAIRSYVRIGTLYWIYRQQKTQSGTAGGTGS